MHGCNFRPRCGASVAMKNNSIHGNRKLVCWAFLKPSSHLFRVFTIGYGRWLRRRGKCFSILIFFFHQPNSSVVFRYWMRIIFDMFCEWSDVLHVQVHDIQGEQAWFWIKLNLNKNSYERHFHCGFSFFCWLYCALYCFVEFESYLPSGPIPALQQRWGSAGQIFWPILKECGLTWGGVNCVTSHDAMKLWLGVSYDIIWCNMHCLKWHHVISYDIIWCNES